MTSLCDDGFEGIVTFAEGGCAAVARIHAETFEEAVTQILGRVPGRNVKSIEITDLRYEEADDRG